MDEKYHEQALELAQLRRDQALAALRRQVHSPGQADCADCGERIPAARRKAAPAACRCMPCQTRFERRLKK